MLWQNVAHGVHTQKAVKKVSKAGYLSFLEDHPI